MLTVFCIVCDEPIDDLAKAREIDTDIGEGGVEYICAVCCETDPAQAVRSGPRTATFADGDDYDAFLHDENSEPW